MNKPNPDDGQQTADDGKVVNFSVPPEWNLGGPGNDFPKDAETGRTLASDPATVPAPMPPWRTIAREKAAQAYCLAHGLALSALEESDEIRIGEIQQVLEPEIETGGRAALAWAGISLYLHSVQYALRQVILRAEVHAPSRGRHNERVLVYADRLSELADVMQLAPKSHAEAEAWWKEREAQLADLAELPRIVAMVEREMGGAPDQAAGHSNIEKLEGMLLGLLGVTAKQSELLKERTAQVNNLMARIKNLPSPRR